LPHSTRLPGSPATYRRPTRSGGRRNTATPARATKPANKPMTSRDVSGDPTTGSAGDATVSVPCADTSTVNVVAPGLKRPKEPVPPEHCQIHHVARAPSVLRVDEGRWVGEEEHALPGDAASDADQVRAVRPGQDA